MSTVQDEVVYQECIEQLEQLPEDMLIFALRRWGPVQRIIAAEQRSSVTIARNASDGWSFEVKAYAATVGEAVAKVTEHSNNLDVVYPAKKK